MVMGSFVMVCNVLMYDSIVVECICWQGIVLIGKMNMLEFGLGLYIYNCVYGIMCNVWNFECLVGGSSGGIVVVLVLIMLFVVDGSDMMGLLCNFVVWNNIYGLCFSFGCVFYGLIGDVFFQ